MKNKVYHVGTLDINQKKTQSYEGSGLSVSEHPQIWRGIARLEGETNILVSKRGLFVDYYSITKEEKEEIRLWGVRNGYIEETDVYRYTYFDDELKRTCYMEFKTKSEALEEADGDSKGIKKLKWYRATDKLLLETKQAIIETVEVEEQLVVLYIDQKGSNFTGVWWNDKMNPEGYSAPRGVIFNRGKREWVVMTGEQMCLEIARKKLVEVYKKGDLRDNKRLSNLLIRGDMIAQLKQYNVERGVFYTKSSDGVSTFLTVGKIIQMNQNKDIHEIDTSKWTKEDIVSNMQRLNIPEFTELVQVQKLR